MIICFKPAIETNLPDDIKERAVSVFKSAVSQKLLVKDSIEKVQREALSEIENVYKGQRFKVSFYHIRSIIDRGLGNCGHL